MQNKEIPLVIKFWKNVSKTDTCWLWTGACDSFGYGHLTVRNPKRTTKKAHRISYELHTGEIPNGMQVCHACDNPKCVNPEHLWIGTLQQNIKDRDIKKRQSHRLTDEQVMEIRKLYIPYKFPRIKLAKMFAVSEGSIQQIILRESYKYLP